MALKIRLQRGGARHKPFYRMVVADARAKRDGRFVEVVGTYDPTNKRQPEQVKIRLDRTDYWVGVGAQPTDTARTLINRARREAPLAETSAEDATTAVKVAEVASAPAPAAEEAAPQAVAEPEISPAPAASETEIEAPASELSEVPSAESASTPEASAETVEEEKPAN
jgi:small subunit ribosomal protein S16